MFEAISQRSELSIIEGPLTFFSGKLTPTHPPPRNGNSIELYTFVTPFPVKFDTPTALETLDRPVDNGHVIVLLVVQLCFLMQIASFTFLLIDPGSLVCSYVFWCVL